MKIFILGATGFLGHCLADTLIAHGHEVTGLIRREADAPRMEQLGATAYLGSSDDPDGLIRAALAADATIFAPQIPTQDEERALVSKMLDAMAGTGKTFVFTSGTGVLGKRTGGEWSDETFAEDDEFTPSKFMLTRIGTEILVREAASRGMRGIVVRPPLIWGRGRHNFVEAIVDSIKATGKACYFGRGLHLYTHVHVEDLAEVYRLAIERGTNGALYHAVAGEVNNRCLAELVGKRLGVETQSIGMDQAIEIWGKFNMLIGSGTCSRSRSPRTRAEFGWQPKHVDVISLILDGEFDILRAAKPA